MSNNNEDKKIDLEKHLKEGRKHPENDPGVIIIYKAEIDSQIFEIRDRYINREILLKLADKDPLKFEVFQISDRHGNIKELKVESHGKVDLNQYGIEKFVTKRLYCFRVGKKEFKVFEPSLTVEQILVRYAEVNPNLTTLAIKTESGYHEYKDLKEEIPLEKCPHFVTFDNDPLPVS